MKIIKKITALFLFCFIINNLIGQNFQNIRGRIIDYQSKYPIENAQIIILEDSINLKTNSDSAGYYFLKNVNTGRINIKISAKDYLDVILNNVILISGKELILNIEMNEAIQTIKGVTKKASRNSKINNTNITLSAKSFDIEDTKRYAGSRNDPARMASNFAGVVGNNDSRNDIIIRGNSPQGLLWRLDGVDIPNPSHFGAMGATGGPVSILNNNVLAKSDFITGAFPSMYGNALAGVFDLQMRNGNNSKSEFTGQIGFNGFEFGAEGPFSKKSKASYMVYYRYSTLAIMQKLGFNFGTGTAVPYYQDLAFKVNIPLKKHQLSFFGMGGKSNIDFKNDENSDSANFYNNDNQELRYRTNMGVVGVNYLHFINKSSFIKTTISTTYTNVRTQVDSISPLKQLVDFYRDNSTLQRISAHLMYNKKFNTKNNISIGVISQNLSFNFNDSVLFNGINFRTLRSEKGATFLNQIYAQWQYKFNGKFTINSGLYYQNLALNNSQSLEPRIGINYSMDKRNNFSFAFGQHSQMQPLQMYFYKTYNENGEFQTNKNLDFSKSNHYVLAYNHKINRFWNVKAEVYYQDLFQIPVELKSSYYSVLNDGADFNPPNRDSLINNGTGSNKGIEFTIEKNFNKGFYLLNSISIYDAKYKGSNGIEKNTAFNGSFIANLLMGKEFKIKSKHILAFDFKMTYAGGRRFTQIDLSQSQINGREVLMNNKSFEEQFKDYFRTDFKVTYRVNGKKITQEWFIDIQNITNNQNVFNQTYNPKTNKVVIQYQLGLYPVFNYRINF